MVYRDHGGIAEHQALSDISDGKLTMAVSMTLSWSSRNALKSFSSLLIRFSLLSKKCDGPMADNDSVGPDKHASRSTDSFEIHRREIEVTVVDARILCVQITHPSAPRTRSTENSQYCSVLPDEFVKEYLPILIY